LPDPGYNPNVLHEDKEASGSQALTADKKDIGKKDAYESDDTLSTLTSYGSERDIEKHEDTLTHEMALAAQVIKLASR
jgi:hypothetical protein